MRSDRQANREGLTRESDWKVETDSMGMSNRVTQSVRSCLTLTTWSQLLEHIQAQWNNPKICDSQEVEEKVVL